MRTNGGWLGVCAVVLLVTRSGVPPAALPELPPPQRTASWSIERTIRLSIEVDEAFVAEHGPRTVEVLQEAIALHNVHWRRYRREWFVLARLRTVPSSRELDASYLLANFLHRTSEERDTIHVTVAGRQLEVYSNGRNAMAIGGLAYRGSDAVLISAPRGVTGELLAYYLFHEIGHCWDALDIPFGGGETTFGQRTRATFQIDAGNEEVMEDAAGPAPRDTPRLAPALIRAKLARARAAARETPYAVALHDLFLHEASPANPAYVRKKEELLAVAPPSIAEVVAQYERTRHHLREDSEMRQQIAEHYWRANDAIRRREYEAAEVELEAIRTLYEVAPDIHFLVGAVERKVRKRR
ncbi:MAG TPA: hypothetical protein VGF48_14680 [Thermoanaerobaculia bacterium]